MFDQTHWMQVGERRSYEAGEYIFREGDPGTHVYAINSGRVAIIKSADGPAPLTLGFRQAGELIGEISLVTHEPRSASVAAIEPTIVLMVSKNKFWELFDTDTHFRTLVMETMIKHLFIADYSRTVAAQTERKLLEIIQLREETTSFIIHDLQGPLSNIMTALLMIEAEPTHNLKSEMGDLVQTAMSGARRMLRLVESLLDAGRFQSGDYALELTQFDLLALACEVIDTASPLATRKRISLTINPADKSLPLVRADRLRIERVIANLIDNALKFTPDGGSVTLSVEQHGQTVEMAVSDTGPGIPPKDRERIFDHYVQSDSGAKTRRGFGLGLAYCRSAVEAHGGRIWADDREGGDGARFLFSLPTISGQP